MTKKAKVAASIISQAVTLALPASVFAQTELVPNTIRPINNLVFVLRAIIQFILVVAFIAAFVMLLIGGIRWITAGGDEKGVASARNMITAALIGLVVVLVAYAIIRLAEIFFGVNIITGGVTIPNVTNPE